MQLTWTVDPTSSTDGYPLTQFARTFGPALTSVGTNFMISTTNKLTPNDTLFVRPNVDTLYSRAVLDLSQVDLALTIPEVDDGRFYGLSFSDLWSNNFANLGSLHETKHGRYLIRMAQDLTKIGFEPAAASDQNYLGYINFPTAYGLLVLRILPENDTTDLDVVHKIQAGILLEKVEHSGPSSAIPALTFQLLGSGALEALTVQPPGTWDSASVRKLFQVMAGISPFNMPYNPQQASLVTRNFTEAGIFNGQYFPPADVDFVEARKLVDASLFEVTKQAKSLGNKWFDSPAGMTGDLGDHYSARCLLGFIGYMGLVPSEAIYPTYFTGGQGLHLEPDESYIFNFSGKPPVQGFWSLTAYNSASYLVANPINRYSLGDQSNITYPDGTPVYGDDDTSRNSPFYILVQPGDVTPPENWISNWLPSPVGGGNFNVNLRLYGPSDALRAGGTYVYPNVTKQAAVTSKAQAKMAGPYGLWAV